MSSSTATVPIEDLPWMLGMIQGLGGAIIGTRPEADGVRVTWTARSSDTGWPKLSVGGQGQLVARTATLDEVVAGIVPGIVPLMRRSIPRNFRLHAGLMRVLAVLTAAKSALSA